MLRRRATWALGSLGLALSGFLLLWWGWGRSLMWIDMLATAMPLYLIVGIVAWAIAVGARLRPAAIALTPPAITALILLLPLVVPPPTPARADDDLIVITHNISNKHGGGAVLTDWLIAQRADVVVLQEVGAWLRDRLPQRVAEAYPHHVYVPDAAGYQGNLLLSAHPIDDDGIVPGAYERGFARHVIDYNGQAIAVYNVSLRVPLEDETDPANPLSYFAAYNARARDQQIDWLLMQIDAETLPAIVAGDFNLTEFSPVYRDLSARLVDGYRAAGIGLGATFPAALPPENSRPALPLLRIDYIWHSPSILAISASTSADRLRSDHLPVIVRVRLPLA